MSSTIPMLNNFIAGANLDIEKLRQVQELYPHEHDCLELIIQGWEILIMKWSLQKTHLQQRPSVLN